VNDEVVSFDRFNFDLAEDCTASAGSWCRSNTGFGEGGACNWYRSLTYGSAGYVSVDLRGTGFTISTISSYLPRGIGFISYDYGNMFVAAERNGDCGEATVNNTSAETARIVTFSGAFLDVYNENSYVYRCYPGYFGPQIVLSRRLDNLGWQINSAVSTGDKVECSLPSPSATASVTGSSTPSTSPSRSSSGSPTGSRSGSSTPSPTRSGSSTPSTSPSQSGSASPISSRSSSGSPTGSRSGTATPSLSFTVSSTPSTSPSRSGSASPTSSRSGSSTLSPTRSGSSTPSTSPSRSGSASPTSSRSSSGSPTSSRSGTATPSPSVSGTVSPSPTSSETTSPSATSSVSASNSPTQSTSASRSPISTPSSSGTGSGSGTPVISGSGTPSSSASHSSTISASVTLSTSSTISPTASLTGTSSSTPTASCTSTSTFRVPDLNSPTPSPRPIVNIVILLKNIQLSLFTSNDQLSTTLTSLTIAVSSTVDVFPSLISFRRIRDMTISSIPSVIYVNPQFAGDMFPARRLQVSSTTGSVSIDIQIQVRTTLIASTLSERLSSVTDKLATDIQQSLMKQGSPLSSGQITVTIEPFEVTSTSSRATSFPIEIVTLISISAVVFLFSIIIVLVVVSFFKRKSSTIIPEEIVSASKKEDDHNPIPLSNNWSTSIDENESSLYSSQSTIQSKTSLLSQHEDPDLKVAQIGANYDTSTALIGDKMEALRAQQEAAMQERIAMREAVKARVIRKKADEYKLLVEQGPALVSVKMDALKAEQDAAMQERIVQIEELKARVARKKADEYKVLVDSRSSPI
jgi:hypothetical protein